eukprot:15459555-Alexandrium_andersonii.AAC.1
MLNHTDIYAQAKIGPDNLILFRIVSGVIQGCPMAASCFLLAFEPFLRMMNDKLKVPEAPKAAQVGGNLPGLYPTKSFERACIRACADDVGTALQELRDVSILQSCFQRAEDLAGL